MKITKVIKVNFDICTFCNHKCTFCANSDSRTLKDTVSYENYLQTMDNITRYIDIKELALSAKGEVLLNKDLNKIISASKNIYNIPYVYFSTNGALLNNNKIDELLTTGIDSIKFSINATNKFDYKKIHLKDDFDKVINNLKYLLSRKQEQNLKLKIFISVVTDEEKISISNNFQKILDDLYIQLNDIFIYKLQYRPKDEIKYRDVIIDSKNCLISPLTEIYINSDCSLGFCCIDYFDEINFGSLLTNDFYSLYNGEEYTLKRQNFIDNSFEKNSLCFNCLISEGLKK